MGSDADLVVFDPKHTGKISAKTHHMSMDYNLFEDMGVNGQCNLVTAQGNIQVRDGEFVGKKGIG